jgi:uncharacterized flavoprotein (TIGR03862 family)
MKNKSVAIIGTGPSGLMAGTVLAENGWKVIFFDHKKAPARKFLVAGNGGFNLTNTDPLSSFNEKYDQQLIKDAVANFTNDDFRDFLKKIGIETYAGSSGKVFPIKGIKPIMVLTKWLEYLDKFDVEYQYEHKLIDFSSGQLKMEFHKEVKNFSFDKLIFAMGGASWTKTGSTGEWMDLFSQKKIICNTFRSSNSGIIFKSSFDLIQLEGQFIKNCKVFSTSFERLGDITITKTGLEGAPIYALNKEFRIGATVFIDLKPNVNIEKITKIIMQSKNNTEGLRKLSFSKTTIAFLKLLLDKEEFKNPESLATSIKKLEIPFADFQPINEVISTIGGVSFDSLFPTFELQSIPNAYCVGEMLDWDAPTGGYLIQACIASGFYAGKSIVAYS